MREDDDPPPIPEFQLEIRDYSDLAKLPSRVYSFRVDPVSGARVRLADIGFRDGLDMVYGLYAIAWVIVLAAANAVVPGVSWLLGLISLGLPSGVGILAVAVALTWASVKFRPDGVQLHTWVSNGLAHYWQVLVWRRRWWSYRTPVHGTPPPVYDDELLATITPDQHWPARLDGVIHGPAMITLRDPGAVRPGRHGGPELVDDPDGRHHLYLDPGDVLTVRRDS